MTTIAYKEGIMAADSRASEGDTHVTECQKIFKLENGAYLGSSGDDDDREVIELLSQASPSKMPSRKKLAALELQYSGILVFPSGKVFKIEVEHNEERQAWAGSVFEIKDKMCAIGSGASFAYGAMEAGVDAVKAVEIACRRDINSALPVQSVSVL